MKSEVAGFENHSGLYIPWSHIADVVLARLRVHYRQRFVQRALPVVDVGTFPSWDVRALWLVSADLTHSIPPHTQPRRSEHLDPRSGSTGTLLENQIDIDPVINKNHRSGSKISAAQLNP